MVVPRDLLRPATTLKALIDNGSPWLEQATLAQFIRNGSLTAHLKRLRNTYQGRRDAVKTCIEKHFGEVTVGGDAAGTHMLWKLPGRGPPAAACPQTVRSEAVGI